MNMFNSNETKTRLNNTICTICKQPIDVSSDVDDLCKECFFKCAEISHILEYLRNTKIDNLNIINNFTGNNSCPIGTSSSNIKKANTFIANSYDKSDEISAIIIRQSTSEKIKIDKESFVLGCSTEKADYVITASKTISRVHAKIEYTCGQFFLVDMQSKNGTKHNNVKILSGEKVILKNGDEFSLSTEVFKFLSKY